jgi:hypothetical protein
MGSSVLAVGAATAAADWIQANPRAAIWLGMSTGVLATGVWLTLMVKSRTPEVRGLPVPVWSLILTVLVMIALRPKVEDLIGSGPLLCMLAASFAAAPLAIIVDLLLERAGRLNRDG